MRKRFDPAEYVGACEDAKQHAITAWPHEACGAIMLDGTYRPFENKAADPEQAFLCDDERAPLLIQGAILAMVHSHPYPRVERATRDLPRDFGPSETDMRSQMADGLPWGIVATDGVDVSEFMFWGDGIKTPPLFDRPFRHGPSGSDGKGDCYAFIKDYYAEKFNIKLPEGPRNFDWWHNSQDLYRDNFKRAGFTLVGPDEAKFGDVFIAQVNCGVPNHGGILEDGGKIAHHLQGRMSRRDSLLAWRRHIVGWLRHAGRHGGARA